MAMVSEVASGLQDQITNGILHPGERQELSTFWSEGEEIPVIDLNGGDVHGKERKRILQEISSALGEYGFFQIVNHGVPKEMTEAMMKMAYKFYEMPVQNREELYSEEEPNKLVKAATRRNNGEEHGIDWMDYVWHPAHPIEEFIHMWPNKPDKYREVARRYAPELRSLSLKILGLLSEVLGLETGYLEEKFGKQSQILRINFYPSCPNLDLEGIGGHTDGTGISILLQGEVPGLQVLKGGKWITVYPIPNAFVVNLGVHVEALSNGRLKATEHRVITNSSKARISVITFYSPSSEVVVSPAEPLVNEDNPAHYKTYNIEEFLKVYLTKDLSKGSIWDDFGIEA